MEITVECECGEKVELQPGRDYAEPMRKNEILDVWVEWSEINVTCEKCKVTKTFDVNGY